MSNTKAKTTGAVGSVATTGRDLAGAPAAVIRTATGSLDGTSALDPSTLVPTGGIDASQIASFAGRTANDLQGKLGAVGVASPGGQLTGALPSLSAVASSGATLAATSTSAVFPPASGGGFGTAGPTVWTGAVADRRRSGGGLPSAPSAWVPAIAGAQPATAFAPAPDQVRAEFGSLGGAASAGASGHSAQQMLQLLLQQAMSPLATWNGGIAPLAGSQSAVAGGRAAGGAPGRGPLPSLPGGPGAFGLLGGGDGASFLLLFASLAGALLWAAPRLGRSLRPTPDLVPLQHASAIEVPG